MRKIINQLCQTKHLTVEECNNETRLLLHQSILDKKWLLKKVFMAYHQLFKKLNHQFFSGQGIEVEIGAGVFPIRNTYPEVLATDIVSSPHLDKVINAEAMDFNASTVKTIYGQNCFHHFSKPELFFKELERTLIPGGGAILLEPHYGIISSILHKRLFQTETFDKKANTWNTPDAGPMYRPNQALSYIVFIRDRTQFEKLFPSLNIVYMATAPHYLQYIISGGLNFKQLLPNFMHKLIEIIETMLKPLDSWLAVHHVIVLKKIET